MFDLAPPHIVVGGANWFLQAHSECSERERERLKMKKKDGHVLRLSFDEFN